MAAKVISYDAGTMHSTVLVDDYSGSDFNKLGQRPGEKGKDELANNTFRFGDLCIDSLTGQGHWLRSDGWL